VPKNNYLYGDAQEMHDNARGGDDTLRGGKDGSTNFLFGDSLSMSDNARDGDDMRFGDSRSVLGAAENVLYGDAYSMSDNAHGGDDTLISGTGTDHMWGDAQVINGAPASPTAPIGSVVTGADTFVFAPGNGNDDINDFRQSDHDKIDVRAYGFDDIADMTITADGNGNTRIAFDANDGVTLVGISDPHILRASDFLFDLLGSDTAAMAKPPGAVPSACWHPCLLSGASIPASRMGVPLTSVVVANLPTETRESPQRVG
jgi:serralysin